MLAALLAGQGCARAPEVSSPPPAPASGEEFARRLHGLINAERSRHGLAPLARATCAEELAADRSAALARRGRLRHQPLRELLRACDSARAAENLGSGQATPEATLRAWLSSSRHRANLLSPRFREVGVAAARSSGGRWYVVAGFVGE